MSLGRKTHDGDILRGSTGFAEWGDPFDSKSQTHKYAGAKRTGRNTKRSEVDESPFAEEGDKDRYLITYADLITLLLGLFIILYAISNIDVKKYEKMMTAVGDFFGSPKVVDLQTEIMKDMSAPAGTLKDELERLIYENNYAASIKLEENDRGITIHIMENILFPSGSADLAFGSISVLGKLAAIIKTLPNDIRIEGHTDNIPIKSSVYPSNWHLSVARALNTAYYLIEIEKVPADKVSIVGYAEYQPIQPNETPEGRSLNRRVDIVIIKKAK